MTAAFNGQHMMVKKLIDAGANVNAVKLKNNGFTVLHLGAEGGSAKVAQLLLEARRRSKCSNR